MHIGLGSGGPLEFLIPASGNYYLNLSHCYLYLKCGVLKTDGLTIETMKADASHGADSSVGPVNLLFHSPFRQVDLVINNALVAISGDTYSYRAYLIMKISAWWLAGWWSPTISCLTSRVSSTRTYCCMSNFCPTTQISGWCCCMLVCVPPHGHLVSSRKLMYALRRPSWRYARSRSLPLNSCAWRRPWPHRGPNTP